MGFPGLINHLLNFVLPALALALAMPLLVRWMHLGGRANGSMGRHVLVLTLVNVAVLVGGLWMFGRDGKMATYLAMAFASASCQWLMLKAWRD